MTTLTTTPPTDVTDAELTRRAGRSDEAALRALYGRHSRALIAFLRARDPRVADDVHHDAWLRIVDAAESVDAEGFRAWALQLTRNVLADRSSRGTVQTVGLDDYAPIQIVDDRAEKPFASHRDALAACIEGLTRAEAQVVRARLEGVDNARIAEKAGVPIEKVAKLFQQARLRLAVCQEQSAAAGPLVLELPDEPEALGPWLDRQVVGMGLGQVVSELEAVHAGRVPGPPPGLDAVLAGRQSAVLDSGLSALSYPSLRELFRHPGLLLEVQERVLEGGGPYWAGLQADDAELASAVEAAWPGVRSALGAPPASAQEEPQPAAAPLPSATAPATPTAAAAVPTGRPVRAPWVRLLRFWARSATVAASALLFLYLTEHLDPLEKEPSKLPSIPFAARAEWGWNRPGVLHASHGSPAAYLNALAEAANEWFDDLPISPGSLALRLGEFRTGCSRLIVAEHASLPRADRTWLVERCREWAGKLDEAVHALERGGQADAVRGQVDAIVNGLKTALHERARAA